MDDLDPNISINWTGQEKDGKENSGRKYGEIGNS